LNFSVYLNKALYIDNAVLVKTDSGGLQNEAYFFALPYITMREEN
jgi:UDP-GlcNAc3NAcA epimerase